jgi:4-hydroxybenzoate polyprenyltransferase
VVGTLRTIYRYWTGVVFLGVLAQIGAAGYGAFYTAHKLRHDNSPGLSHKAFEHGWNFHTGFGYVVIGGMIVLLILGLLARLGKPLIWWPLGLAIAGVLQVVWAAVGRAVPGLGFLHVVNALVIFALSGLIAHRSWRKVRAIG